MKTGPMKTGPVKARAAIRVQPRASREGLAGPLGGEWKLLLTAPAVEGKANRACIEFFARGLRAPRSAVRIVSGETSRHKRIEIEGIEQETLDRFLRGEA
jgi:uncharacterized protein (TIGR00251 family)